MSVQLSNPNTVAAPDGTFVEVSALGDPDWLLEVGMIAAI